MPSTGGADHAVKANWVYELPFGRGKKYGSGVSALVDGFIGGWEIDGIARIQSGPKSNFSGYRLVGMTEEEFAGMFKFYHVIDPTTKDANGNPMDRVYMLPQDVIQNSIIALYKTTATTATGYINNVMPTGRYLAPASGPDCACYNVGGPNGVLCPGTKTAPAADRHGADVLEGRHELREADPGVEERPRRSPDGHLQHLQHDQLQPPNFAVGQQPDGVAGHVGCAGRQRLAGSGRPDHVVRSARDVVG